MHTYESLQERARQDDIEVVDYFFQNQKIKGLICNNTIAIQKTISTQSEKSCVLAEELGHYYTTAGDIIDQSSAANRKQELRARLWAYNCQIGLQGIIKTFEHGCKNVHEMADCLDVTEEFLKEAITAYRSKYGVCTEFDNYIIFFEPHIAVLKKVSD